MTKSITYSEKAIGALQIIFGALMLSVFFFGLKRFYDVSISYFQLTWDKISILKVIKAYHSEFILEALTIISGLLILINRKSGWMLTLITSFVTGMTGVISFLYLCFMPAKSGLDKSESMLLDFIILLIFFSIFFFLFSKPFKTKYNPTRGTWWTIIIVAGLLLMDKIIFDVVK